MSFRTKQTGVIVTIPAVQNLEGHVVRPPWSLRPAARASSSQLADGCHQQALWAVGGQAAAVACLALDLGRQLVRTLGTPVDGVRVAQDAGDGGGQGLEEL